MIHISYPSIIGFRDIIKTVKHIASWNNAPLPKLRFTGSVKLHGTNASIVMNKNTGEVYAQSRNNILSTSEDNMGFYANISPHMEHISSHISKSINEQHDIVVIFGEWCGNGISKGVALSKMNKNFVIFDIKLYSFKNNEVDLIRSLSYNEVLSAYNGLNLDFVKCIYDFKSYEVIVDFDQQLNDTGDYLTRLTDEVENKCPFAEVFGTIGTGEGIVWRCVDDWTFTGPIRNPESYEMTDVISTRELSRGFIFKTKGEKHKDTKTEQIVDLELVNSVNELVDKVLTEHRLEKMFDKTMEGKHEITMELVPFFLKNLGQDVIKEESDMIDESGLDRKNVMKSINARGREWFKEKYNNQQL